MNDLAAKIGDQFAQPAPGGDDLLAGIEADLADHADDVALRRRRFRSDDEIRSAQDEHVQRVVLQHEGVVDQFADLPARRGGLDLVEGVERLGRGHVMGGGADAADAAGDLRHVFRGTAEAEHLEAPQLRDLQVGAFDVALVVEVDVDLAVALEPRDRIDRDVALGGGIGRIGPEVALVEGLFCCVVHGKKKLKG